MGSIIEQMIIFRHIINNNKTDQMKQKKPERHPKEIERSEKELNAERYI